jgi:hypothetical protein
VVFPSKCQLYDWSQDGVTTRWVGVQLTFVWGNLKNFNGVGSWYIDGGVFHGTAPLHQQHPVWSKRQGGIGRESGMSRRE